MDVANLVLDIGQIRRDARNGRLSVEMSVDIIEKQQQTIKRLAANERRLVERLTASYSLDAEIKRRQRRRRRKKSPGRQPTTVKFADAEQFRNVYPDRVRHADCELVRERALWRIEDGKAVRVGYRIFAGPVGKEPRIPGVTPRCDYGIEILVMLAFLVYLIGISLDKAWASAITLPSSHEH